MVSAVTQSQAKKKGQDKRLFFESIPYSQPCWAYSQILPMHSLYLSPDSPVLNPEASFGLVLVI